MRARDLGISIGLITPGPQNAITDVAGVRVGHATIIEGDPGPLTVGQGPVRSGVDGARGQGASGAGFAHEEHGRKGYDLPSFHFSNTSLRVCVNSAASIRMK